MVEHLDDVPRHLGRRVPPPRRLQPHRPVAVADAAVVEHHHAVARTAVVPEVTRLPLPAGLDAAEADQKLSPEVSLALDGKAEEGSQTRSRTGPVPWIS